MGRLVAGKKEKREGGGQRVNDWGLVARSGQRG